ncbi:hypothetical protein N9X61_00415 [Sulfurimonas sp.]|nr:hypothetical protein [Sulfurimonas sp.]
MFNKIVKTTVALSLVATVAFAANSTRFNVIDGDVGEKYENLLNDSLESKIGFVTSDGNGRINDAYATKYGDKSNTDYDKDWKKNLDNLGFFTIVNDKKLHSLLKVSPEVAGFSPFNQLIYKKMNENKSYVGHLDPNTMLDIVGTKDTNTRKEFVAMFDTLDKWTATELGGKVETSTFNALPAKTMMRFEIPVDRSGDVADFLETYQENYEAAFEDKKYIIAGYRDFKETYADLEMDFEEYDAFFVYSLCHFTFSYNIFNKGRPDAGVFAPCSMYAYIKKDSDTMVLGMPTLANWPAIMDIKDPAKLEWVKKIDAEIISIMKSMGAKEI